MDTPSITATTKGPSQDSCPACERILVDHTLLQLMNCVGRMRGLLARRRDATIRGNVFVNTSEYRIEAM